MPRRPYTWRWQLQPQVVTKEPPASDVVVPAYYRPAINGPALGALHRRTQVPVDGVWPAGVPHPNGPAFRARPLKIWRKRLLRETVSSGKATRAGIGMPMDRPGGLASVAKGAACTDSVVCAFGRLRCSGINEAFLSSGGAIRLTFLGEYDAHSLLQARQLCTSEEKAVGFLWSEQNAKVRLYGCEGCQPGTGSTFSEVEKDAKNSARPSPFVSALNAGGSVYIGEVYQKTTCRPSSGRCGGAILKDDTKSRAQGVPVRKPAPGDSFYDPAAFKSVCVACTPENNRIRSTVQPVLGPGPDRSVDRMVTSLRRPGGPDAGVTTIVLKEATNVTDPGPPLPFPVDPVNVFEVMTVEEARQRLKSSPDTAAAVFKRAPVRPGQKIEVRFVPAADKTREVYNPEFNAFVKEPVFFEYVQAATDYRSYFHSRCREIYQRRGRGNLVPGLPYFDSKGIPLAPSDSPDIGPPNYRPVTCPFFPARPTECSSPYKTNNPRFGIQGAVQSSARLARLRYEALTRGTNFITAGALHANNFGEFSGSPPSGYFLPQRANVARCFPGLYRRSGSRLSCFKAEPTPLQRIEH